MYYALFPNLAKPTALQVAQHICTFLQKKGVHVTAEKEVAHSLRLTAIEELPPEQIHCLICLGGDGTILRTFHRHLNLQAPILGINLGSLGFMADVPVEALYPALETVLRGEYRIEERLIIEGHIDAAPLAFAVNEVVLHRAHNPSLIELSIYVGDRFLNRFSADGLILATPNGSTAYSLAAGGPIVTPSLPAWILTPICPHTISNRPIVLCADQPVRLEYLSPYSPIEVTYDGFPLHRLSAKEPLTLRPAQRPFRLITFANHDFFATLRTKLGWSGSLTHSFKTLFSEGST